MSSRIADLVEPEKAVDPYVGDGSTQHEPDVADGQDGFIACFVWMAEEYPVKTIEFVRAVVQGYLVARHTRQTWPGDEQCVTASFFRFDADGMIVKPWDAIQ